MIKTCDHTSVGVVLRNSQGELALIERRNYPYGFAPPAGHIDDHGGPEQTAIEEVYEEVGVTLSLEALKRTVIFGRNLPDHACKRGVGHQWWVFDATADQQLNPDENETRGASWVSLDRVDDLANRTRAYLSGDIPEDEWQKSPGLEPVWLSFLTELKVVEVTGEQP